MLGKSSRRCYCYKESLVKVELKFSYALLYASCRTSSRTKAVFNTSGRSCGQLVSILPSTLCSHVRNEVISHSQPPSYCVYGRKASIYMLWLRKHRNATKFWLSIAPAIPCVTVLPQYRHCWVRIFVSSMVGVLEIRYRNSKRHTGASATISFVETSILGCRYSNESFWSLL